MKGTLLWPIIAGVLGATPVRRAIAAGLTALALAVLTGVPPQVRLLFAEAFVPVCAELQAVAGTGPTGN